MTGIGRFKLGPWLVDPARNRISRGTRLCGLQPQTMDLLLYLVHRRNDVVSADELLENVWKDRVVTQASIYSAFKQLREALDDDAGNPRFVETIPKRGYRLVAPVEFLDESGRAPGAGRPFLAWGAWTALALALALAVAWTIAGRNGSTGTEDAARTTRPLLAVLPFEDHSLDGAGLPLANGLHEELLTRLARLRQLKVLSKTSVVKFRGAAEDPAALARELNVDLFVEGGLQLDGQQVRVHIQLIDAGSQAHLWAESFTRELDRHGLFRIQADITDAVASAMEIELTQRDRERLVQNPADNLPAYEAFLTGKHHLSKRTIPDIEDAARHFRNAISLDPDYALAWVGLGDALYLQATVYSAAPLPNESLLHESREAVDRALELDDQLGEAYATLGMLLEESDLERAEAAFLRSFELSPNYATARHWYGGLLRKMNRPLEATLEQLEMARELDPLSLIINEENANLLDELGRFDEARNRWDLIRQIDPHYRLINTHLGYHEWTVEGRIDRAMPHFFEAASEALGRSKVNPHYLASTLCEIGQAYGEVSDWGNAALWIRKSLEQSPGNGCASLVQLHLGLVNGSEFEGENYPDLLLQFEPLLDPTGYYVQPALRAHVYRLYRNFDLAAGRLSMARDRYARHYPELLQAEPAIDRANVLAAVDLAWVHRALGQEARAGELAAGSLEVLERLPRRGYRGFGVADAMAYSALDQPDEALAALRRAVDEGWRYLTGYFLEVEPSLSPLYGYPAFREIVSDVEADLAEQGNRIAEMLRRGEIAPPPLPPTEDPEAPAG